MDATTVEEKLLDGQLPGLLPPEVVREEGWALPRYEGLSIANLPATVAALLGPGLPGALPPLPEEMWADWLPGLRRVVLVVLDALGYRLLQGRWAAGRGGAFAALSEAGRLVPLTSVFPSTTDAALVSLSTGCPPAQHGWLAYTMYLREMGMASNAILLSPLWTRQRDLLLQWGLVPDELVTIPTLAARLGGEGIATVAVLQAFFGNSGFTQMLYRGVDTMRYHRVASDLWVHLRHALAKTRGKRALITAYWSGLDTLAHAYGPDADFWDAEFDTVDYLLGRQFLEALPAQDRQGTLLLITADHGQIRVPPDHILTASKDAELNRHLMAPIVGESRAAFVYPRRGRAEAIHEYLETRFPGWFVVLDSAQALDGGLLGSPVTDEAYARAGELLVLPRGDHALQQKIPPVSLVGRHGGLTQDEMLVPLIGSRLEALA